MAEEKQKCVARVGGGFDRHGCTRYATAEVDGKHYCTIHNPIKRKEKDEIRRKQWEKEWADSRERIAYESAAIQYCRKKGLTVEQLNDAILGAAE